MTENPWYFKDVEYFLAELDGKDVEHVCMVATMEDGESKMVYSITPEVMAEIGGLLIFRAAALEAKREAEEVDW